MHFDNEDGREPGFFFSVTGVPANSNVRFQFPKLSNQGKLLSYGHKPVYLKVSDEVYKELVNGKKAFYEQDWQRIPSEVEFGDIGFVFECPIGEDFKETDHMLFAYSYPFNLNDVEHSISKV